VEALVIMFFFGLSAGTIAKIKGSSFFIWLMIGTALPMIGTIAALLYRNEREEPMRRCPECNNVVRLSTQVCTRCGRDLDFPQATAGTVV
jgi:DNA-directed RNA polymerase subunit RPC12/RpoP